ncbi:TetR/AcrR family transcriptional regulator [Streptomyces sp. NPDC058371]|uniref:TetR/AcrR family transcriptional regulator n=1 Tax=Streptomyces sp. NPDC058371 TaxID=3346463 RepID=UPI0036585C5E
MAEAMGLRERKKLQTGLRIWRTAVELFLERGFDQVSVMEIAEASDVSKMTVFNYFGSKEDLVFLPMEEHFGDVARAVRDRQPGESAVAAVRRYFLEMIESRDPSIGLSPDPFVRQVRQLVMDTPALLERAFLASRQGEQELIKALMDEGEERVPAGLAAALLIAVRNTLIEEHHRRASEGESADEIAAAAVDLAHRAFDQVENGLGGYAVRP